MAGVVNDPMFFYAVIALFAFAMYEGNRQKWGRKKDREEENLTWSSIDSMKFTTSFQYEFKCAMNNEDIASAISLALCQKAKTVPLQVSQCLYDIRVSVDAVFTKRERS